MQLLSSPLFAGIFGAVFATLITILVTNYIYRFFNNPSQIEQGQKKITFEITTNTPVLEEQSNLQILLGNKPVSSARLIILKLSNVENELISLKDHILLNYNRILAVASSSRYSITFKVPNSDIFRFIGPNESLTFLSRILKKDIKDELRGKNVLIIYDSEKIVVKPISWKSFIKGSEEIIELEILLSGIATRIKVATTAEGKERKLEDIYLSLGNADLDITKGEQ